MKKLISLLLIAQFIFPSLAQAQSDLFSTSRKVDQGLSSGTVYYSGNYPGAVLMRVNMLGEVQRPGVHHMPVETDFSTALGYAGGPTRFANTKDAVVKRRNTDGSEEVIPMNLNSYFKEVHRSQFQLKPNDTIFVPQKEAIISDNTFRVIITLSFVAGIILSAVSIHSLTRGN